MNEGQAIVSVIHYPGWVFGAGAGALLLVWLVCFKWVLRGPQDPGPPTMEDLSIPRIDGHAPAGSLFHRWDPRFKIVALGLFSLAVVSLNRLEISLMALGIAVVSAVACRVPARAVLRRLTAMAGFLSMFVLVMPFTVPCHPGDMLIVFGALENVPFNLRGLQVAFRVVLKASTVAVLMVPLFETAPFTVSMEALASIGVPRRICEMLLMTHRYVFVFQHESHRMMVGMRVRGFRRRTDMATMKTIANFLGMLLVRSFERTHRVYEAMLCRGYDGRFPCACSFQANRMDLLFGTAWVVGALALVAADHLMAFSLP